MIYQKDWLMRQIERIIAVILHFLAHTSKEEEFQAASLWNKQIDCFLEQGDICGAENWIYENLDDQESQWLHASVYFYKKINTYSDEYLTEHDFSRDEILSGLTEVGKRFGLEHIV